MIHSFSDENIVTQNTIGVNGNRSVYDQGIEARKEGTEVPRPGVPLQ